MQNKQSQQFQFYFYYPAWQEDNMIGFPVAYYAPICLQSANEENRGN